MPNKWTIQESLQELRRCGTCGEFMPKEDSVLNCGIRKVGECIAWDRKYWHPVGTLDVEEERDE